MYIRKRAQLSKPNCFVGYLRKSAWLLWILNTLPDVEKSPVTSDNQSDIVDFEGEDDPKDPLNWSSRYKWTMVILISLLSLVVYSSLLATPDILRDLKSNNQLESTFLVSVWELGEVIGPLIVAPLSETYGRLPIYHAGNFLFIIFSIVAAKSTSTGMLIAMRFLLGLSVASTVINPCIVGDMFREQHRGRALAIMGMIPFIAPVVGPSIGGVISDKLGWRWTFWLIAIIAGLLQILFFISYREAYRVRILQVKAAHLRKKTGNPNLEFIYEHERGNTPPSVLIRRTIMRPLKLLTFSPAVSLVSLVGALGMGQVYVIMTTLPEVYENRYHFQKNIVGLTYWGVGTGMILSTLTVGHFIDWYLVHRAKSHKDSSESRLPPMILGSLLVPLGILSYGWAVQYELHWIAPIMFTTLIWYGYVSVAIASWTYLVDVFGIYSASATAGCVLLRNIGGACLPLAAPALVHRIDWGWGLSALALVGLSAVPMAVVLMLVGGRIRSNEFHRNVEKE